MSRPLPKRKSKTKEPKAPPSRFAPAAFLKASPEAAQELCAALASQAAKGFSDLTGTSWKSVASSFVEQLRASGHDLSNVEDTDAGQEWQATWYHPRGTFSLFLKFRVPASVEVTWQTDDATFTASA